MGPMELSASAQVGAVASKLIASTNTRPMLKTEADM